MANKSRVFWWILLVLGLFWFLDESSSNFVEIDIISFNVPWLPLIFMIVALKFVIDSYDKGSGP